MSGVRRSPWRCLCVRDESSLLLASPPPPLAFSWKVSKWRWQFVLGYWTQKTHTLVFPPLHLHTLRPSQTYTGMQNHRFRTASKAKADSKRSKSDVWIFWLTKTQNYCIFQTIKSHVVKITLYINVYYNLIYWMT